MTTPAGMMAVRVLVIGAQLQQGNPAQELIFREQGNPADRRIVPQSGADGCSAAHASRIHTGKNQNDLFITNKLSPS